MSKFSRNRLNSRCLSIEHLEPREMLHGGCHTVDVPIEGTFVIEECYSADCDVSCNLIIELSPSLENDRDKVDKAITLNGFMEDDFVYNTNQSDPDNEGRLIGINVGKHSIFGNIDFAGCDKLEVFNISDAADTEEITGINLSGCAILNDVVWGDDMSGLESLNISGTVLVSLDVSGFGGLTSLDVSNCLDLGGYPGILDFSGNKLFLSKADASGSLGVDLSVCFGTQTNAPIAEKLANGAAIDLSAEFKLLAGGTIKWFDEDGVPANGFFVDTEGKGVFTLTNCELGRAYYCVIDYYGDGFTVTETSSVTAVLATPVVTVGEVTDTTVALSWDPVEGADKYLLYGWCEIEEGHFVEYWAETEETSFVFGDMEDVELYPNTFYTFRVQVLVDEQPASEWSEDVTAATLALATPKVGWTATASTVTLTWNPVDDALSYVVEMSEDEGETWRPPTGGVGGSESFLATGLTAGTAYMFRVKAVGAGEAESTWCEVTATTTLGKLTRPVLEVDTEATTNKSITLTWEEVPYAAYYTLEWKLSSDNGQNPNWTEINNITGTTHTVDGLAANIRYHFRITAHAAGYNDSTASLVVGETTLANKLARPVLEVDTEATTNKSVTLTWEAVRGATYYTLEWKLSSDNSQNPTWYKIENVTGTSYTVDTLTA
ncbi:MAG: fibronectin type III domain-containing protein, partial [Planctomycetaceae bacterium]|nr:fibronectin type III domain-containing protein [Planctomycetaceae bacterium]